MLGIEGPSTIAQPDFASVWSPAQVASDESIDSVSVPRIKLQELDADPFGQTVTDDGRAGNLSRLRRQLEAQPEHAADVVAAGQLQERTAGTE